MIVKVCGPLVPPAVVTVTVRAPVAAAGSSTKLAVSDVLLPTTTLLTVTPAPLTVTVVAPTTKLVPVSVTATVAALDALIRRDAGQRRRARRRRELTVKVCAPLVPPAVVTVTVRGPGVAAASISECRQVSDVAADSRILLGVTVTPYR